MFLHTCLFVFHEWTKGVSQEKQVAERQNFEKNDPMRT